MNEATDLLPDRKMITYDDKRLRGIRSVDDYCIIYVVGLYE